MGITATDIIMQIDNNCGYSFIVNTFAVTSSRIVSPNIIQPRTAIAQSREYCHKVLVSTNVDEGALILLTVKI